LSQPGAIPDFLKGAVAWLTAVVLMALAFGLFVSVEKIVNDTFPNYPGANLLDEVVGWASISVFFIAAGSLLVALPAVWIARSFSSLSLAKTLALGAMVGPVGSCLIGAPMIDNKGEWGLFALAGLTCGLVGAVVWWFLYERSRTRLTSRG
jgi:hypothetical protein